MIFDPISREILNEFDKHTQQSIKEEREKKEKSSYWVRCPNCGKRVVKKELIKKGCYLCGWQGTEEDIELAKARFQSGQDKAKTKASGYRSTCPRCGTSVITEELFKNGCYRCGYKTSKLSDNEKE